MPEIDPQIEALERRLDRLVKTQVDFQLEVNFIRAELKRLRGEKAATTTRLEPLVQPPPERPKPPVRPTAPPAETRSVPPREVPPPTFGASYTEPKTTRASQTTARITEHVSAYTETAKADLEKFIGENLISKIGILVLIIGVGIGTKYAIDNDLISPLTRIILGYFVGFGLLGMAVRLKPKYHNFSAVLLSGGMASLYFVTYFAYSIYQLIPLPAAFVLMVMFTTFTVASAVFYRRQVIAHIGLVGAYAVPFLLSSGSGNYPFLFTYMAILNAGILAVSVWKVWRPIFYTASVFTWVIFISWLSTRYTAAEHLYLALTFLAIFFAILYATKLVHVVFRTDGSALEDIISVTATTVVFYGCAVGISMFTGTSTQYAVLFTYFAAMALALLASSFRHIRRPVFYAASGFTWLTIILWLATRYAASEHLYLALTFLAIFFGLFYVVKILHGVFHSDANPVEDLISMIITTVVFYGCVIAVGTFTGTSVQYEVLFGYLAAIALLLLISSFRFYGRALVFVTYPFTWLIFGIWFLNRYSSEQHFALAVTIAVLFFAVFYGATLIYRLATDDIGMAESAGLMLTNSLIFYGFGYAIMDSRIALQPYQGLFTVAHAAFHSLVSQAVNRFKPAAVDVVQVLAVLIVTFSTAAVPIQFDGNLVTIIWSIEAAVLFYFGRIRGVVLFEYFSYPLMFLATCSLGLDWLSVYSERSTYALEFASRPFANGQFVTGLVFTGAFALIYVLNADKTRMSAIDTALLKPVGYVIAVIGTAALYNTFRMEIGTFFHLEVVRRLPAVPIEHAGVVVNARNSAAQSELGRFNIVTQIDYTLLFLTIMAIVNLRKVRSYVAAYAGIGLSIVTLMIFTFVGLYTLFELRQSYLNGTTAELFGFASSNVAVRYISYVFVTGALVTLFKYSYSELTDGLASADVRTIGFDAILYSTALIVASCELMNISAHLHVINAEKYGLSILWGTFALMLIAIGIGRRKKHLRIAAIVLLGVTLAKLFFYDITDLGTIAKTFLFVLLGLLMLVMSFLYNKYKDKIFGNEI